MKNVILAATAGLAIVAGAVVVDAHRERGDRIASTGDQARVSREFGWQGGRGPAGGVQGPGRGGPGRGGPGRFGGPMLEALDLSDDQRSSREAVGQVAVELATAQRALHLATFADSRDDGEIAKLTSTIANLEKQLLDQRVKTEIEIAGVLTTEQREKVRAGRGRGR